MARQVLDIFLSSTSEDLREFRAKVSEVIGRLGQFAVRMETWGARPSKPLTTCREEVARSDALIVVVGHRYGWVPSRADGGDDVRSITWWEVQWALDAGKPVYAFLVDTQAPWVGPREQDRLLTSPSEEETLSVWRSVRGLRDFRAFLDSKATRATFATAEQLGTLVATGLFPWLLERAGPTRPSAPGEAVSSPLIPADAVSPSPPVAARGPEQTFWQEQIHLLSARRLVNQRAPVRVAVVAGRPRLTHPAMAGVAVTQVAAAPGAPATEADDYTTGLAALIAASGGDGFQGVAPGAELLALSVLDENLGSSNAAIAGALDRAVLGGACIVCMGLGGMGRSPVVEQALLDAVAAGVTIVCPAGNSGSPEPHYPAALDGCIAVGAAGPDGAPTEWTTYGDWVHVSAPGDDVPLPAGATGYTTSKGTAWSCAIATGVGALLLQAHPQLSPAELKRILVETAAPSTMRGAGRRNERVPGLVNAYRAVSRVITA